MGNIQLINIYFKSFDYISLQFKLNAYVTNAYKINPVSRVGVQEVSHPYKTYYQGNTNYIHPIYKINTSDICCNNCLTIQEEEVLYP